MGSRILFLSDHNTDGGEQAGLESHIGMDAVKQCCNGGLAIGAGNSHQV